MLYRKDLDGTLFRCLERDDSRVTLQEVHVGICGSHSSGFTPAKKILRMGYFWPIMENYSILYSKTYKKFQIHGNLVHVSSQELNPLATPWPFCQWGFDLIQTIHPPSFGINPQLPIFVITPSHMTFPVTKRKISFKNPHATPWWLIHCIGRVLMVLYLDVLKRMSLGLLCNHVGICRSHSSGFTLTKKILKIGCFWQPWKKIY